MVVVNTVERWTMYRAILYNFWYYPNQELIFKDGCAVLRGHNGSGKSVTTQSLITVLLDGDTRPHKLDPFGGRERKITDTVLGEEHLLKINHRIGYLALEFKKPSGITKTIGLGIEADREKKKSTSWGFVVDGKRIGENDNNLHLYSKGYNEGEKQNFAFSEKELTDEIEGRLKCGKVYSDREDYARAVNKHLFGFDEDGYKGLIDLLLKARSPKLSDQNKPEGAAEVLNDSLPRLSDEELRPLVSSIESINRIENDLLSYRSDLTKISSLADVYRSYNELVTAEKADSFLKSVNQLENTKTEINKLEKQLKSSTSELEEIGKKIRNTKDEIEVRREEQANLGVKEIEEVKRLKDEQENMFKKYKSRNEKLSEKEGQAKRLVNKYSSDLENQQLELEVIERDRNDDLLDLNGLSDEMDFAKHQLFFDHYDVHKEEYEYQFANWKRALDDYKHVIEEAKTKLEEFEQLNREKGSLDDLLGDIRLKIDDSQTLIDEEQEKYEDCITTLREGIATWKLNLNVLGVSSELEDDLLFNLENVFEEMTKEDYFGGLIKHYNDMNETFLDSKRKIDHQITLEDEKIEVLNEELGKWETKKEIEPNFTTNKKEGWGRLREKGVDFLPFYEAYEFKPVLTAEQKILLQNALYETGILSSIVVAKEDVKLATKHSVVLTYNKEKERNLSQVLEGVGGVHLDQILQGISFEFHEDGFILNDGSFANNFVEGSASLYDENVFIGKLAREEYRQKMIKDLKSRISDAELNRNSLVNERDSYVKKIEEIKREYDSFPDINILKEHLKVISQLENTIIEVLNPQKKDISKKIEKIEEEIRGLKGIIMKSVNDSNLKLSLDVYNQELRNIKEYGEVLAGLTYKHKSIQSAKEKLTTITEQLKTQEEIRDEAHDDLVEVEIDTQKVKRAIEMYDGQLKSLGDVEILNRLSELTELINHTLPNKVEELTKEQTKLEGNIEIGKDKLDKTKRVQLPFEKILKDSWEKAFQEQLLLNLIPFDDEMKSIIDKAHLIMEKFGFRLDKERVNIGKAKNLLSKKFQADLTELPMYELELEHKTSEYVPVWETENASINERLNYIKEQMTRDVVSLEFEEVRISPSIAVERLTKKIGELEQDAHEQDRHLYQDILINTLGAGIRRKIQYVERWEKEMNNYMEHENIIKFRIKWVPKKADPNNQDEIDTKELVDALKKDSRWVDVEQIAKHFRGKVERAKSRFSKDNDMSLQQIMKDLLDYRNWFEFQIFFTKKGDKEKPLNRKTYGELSGGQRVLAMVTPVLAALYAKYSEGREDAPRIFTLDEAFARVDDENINIMFEYIYKLGFNYILNSQSLWGTFETVPSLNIYELSRPDNRPFVAIQSYYWNGHKRERIGDDWFAGERESAVALDSNE